MQFPLYKKVVYKEVVHHCSKSQESSTMGFCDLRKLISNIPLNPNIHARQLSFLLNVHRFLAVTYVLECYICAVPVCDCNNAVLCKLAYSCYESLMTASVLKS